MPDYEYVGDELDLFAKATNWKSYLFQQISPYLGRSVLEVGAGCGGTTKAFSTGQHDQWLCLEPDPSLEMQLKQAIENNKLPSFCESKVGVLNELDAGMLFDSILYIDVLEHIEDDHAEFQRIPGHLSAGGYAIILCPAHNFLFSPFDKSVGHFRRYNKSMFKTLTASQLSLVKLKYLDAVGMSASLANKYLMKQGLPTRRQVAFWDSVLVPLSRYLCDPCTFGMFGKSILGIWQKKAIG